MNHIAKGVLTAASLAALLSLPVVGQAGQAPSSTQNRRQNDPPAEPVVCDNRAPRINAVKLAAPIANTVDFSGFAFQNNNDIGGFDPIPLLEMKIYIGGKKNSCVIAHFSAQVNTGDNVAVFQASVDDDPMEGHGLFPEDIRFPPISTPIVLDRGTIFSAEMPQLNVPTLASYNFFKIVKPGWHTVKIKWAGCCSSNANSVSAQALAAVLTLEYQGKLASYEHDDD